MAANALTGSEAGTFPPRRITAITSAASSSAVIPSASSLARRSL